MRDDTSRDDAPPWFWRSRLGLGWLILAAAVGWFLWTEHKAHLFGALPWLILLACPLMHVFMHHGHGHRHGHRHAPGGRPTAAPGPSDPAAPETPR